MLLHLLSPPSQFRKSLFFGCIALIPFLGFAQDDTRMRIANLAQDVGLLSRSVAALRLEVESLRDENQTLRKRLVGVDSLKVQLSVINENVLTQVAALEKSIAAGDADTKKTVLNEVAKQIKSLGVQTDRTLKAISDAVNAEPSVPITNTPVTFDSNYPEAGFVYEVQSGDTLSGIARKLDSRVTWIQNANEIADPTKLQAGQTLFIPQAD